MVKKRKVRLVLSSGGARGMAHIGVIEELEREGFEICEVVGCSMGAVVGGIYCAGYLPAYKEWLLKLSKLDVFRLLDFTFSAQGFVKGERVFKAMEQFIGEHNIESFRTPFTAVAVDIIRRKEIRYNQGSLFKALRASIAMPTVFTPVMEGGMQLVDGGVLNPLPLNVISKKRGDIVVAVNLNANVPVAAAQTNGTAPDKERAAYLKMIHAFRTQVLKMEVKVAEQVEKLGFFDLVIRSYDITQDRLTELMIETHKPELVVNVSRDACGVFEFYRAAEIMEEGRKALRKALEKD